MFPYDSRQLSLDTAGILFLLTLEVSIVFCLVLGGFHENGKVLIILIIQLDITIQMFQKNCSPMMPDFFANFHLIF